MKDREAWRAAAYGVTKSWTRLSDWTTTKWEIWRNRYNCGLETVWEWIWRCCSVVQLYPALWNPMDCSTPGFPVLHYLPEFAQTHVHWVGDAIQPSHPLSSPSPPAFNLSSIRVFSSESALHIRWPKYWSFSISPSNEYSGLISSRSDRFDLLAVKGLSRVFSSTTVWKHQFFGAQPSLFRTNLFDKYKLYACLRSVWKILRSFKALLQSNSI